MFLFLPNSRRMGFAGTIGPGTLLERKPIRMLKYTASHAVEVKSRLTRRALLLAGAGAALSGCASGGGGSGGDVASIASSTQVAAPLGSTLADAPVKVALLLPFSKAGEGQKVANALKQAAELALFEAKGANITIIPKDTAASSGAAEAARSAIAEGAELLLGPFYAQDVQAEAPIARAANNPVLAFSSDRKVAGNGVYLLSFLAGDDVARVIAYAASGGKRTFAALVPQTAYGAVVEQTLRTAVGQAGGRLVAVEHYAVDANSIADPVNQLKTDFIMAQKAGAPIDALLIPGGQDALPIVAPMLPYNAIDTKTVRLLGSGGWNYPTIGQEAGLNGGWFAGPDPAVWKDFSDRYGTSYGAPPPRLASLAYDAMTLALALAANPAGQRFLPEKLTRASGFAGVDGLFRLRADGTCERGLAILEVTKVGPHVIDPAPSAFAVAQL